MQYKRVKYKCAWELISYLKNNEMLSGYTEISDNVFFRPPSRNSDVSFV
jgi:hypothetical protein